MLPIAINLLLALHIIVSILIVFVVLMQRPKSEGLGAAFGGGMTENIFGAQTTNVLVKTTRYLGGAFFILTLSLSVLYAKQTTARTAVQQQLLKEQSPATGAPTEAKQPVPTPAEAATPQQETPQATPAEKAASPAASPQKKEKAAAP
jgi:preprotein translocase subunit SecG